VNEVTKAALIRPAPLGQSQWELIAHEFCKRRLALAASLAIVTLATISVFAPFLANDRPIYYFGFNRFEYQESVRTLRGVISQLINTRSKESLVVSKVTELLQTAGRQVQLMSSELRDENSQQLRRLGERLQQSALKTDRSESITELTDLQRELRSAFVGHDENLLTRSRWPAIASLVWSDVALILANSLALFWPIGNWVYRRSNAGKEGGLKLRWNLAILLGIPLIGGLTWWCCVPQRVDRTNYKLAVLRSDDSDKKAAVVFHSVLWPPIPFGVDENDLADKTRAPAWYPQKPSVGVVKPTSRWNGAHWLGTDELGRDILCRMIWGGRISLSVGMVAVAIYVSIGIVVGSLAGYFRGVCDLIVSRIIEVVICFPAFFLILTIVALIGPGLLNIMIVIGLTGWTGIARLVRSEFLRLVDQDFVLASRALGYSPLRIIFRHVLPNAMAPVLVSATFGIAGAILTESALSFLGLGITVPTPSWGGILADGRQALLRAPWLIHFPGLAIFITITSYNLVGEALRDAADPRLRGSR